MLPCCQYFLVILGILWGFYYNFAPDKHSGGLEYTHSDVVPSMWG